MENNSQQRRHRSKHPILKFFLCLLLVLLLCCGAVVGYASLKAKYTVTYQGYLAATGNITNTLEYDSSLQLISSFTATAEAEGEVETIYVSAGDTVTDGQKLMRLSGGQIVKSEMDGTVNTVNVKVGDKVSAGASLIQIADFSHLRVSFSVSEYDIDVVHAGTECTITVTATSQKLSATVKSVDYTSTSRGSIAYYTARVDVTAEDGILPGMQCTVNITETLATGVVVLDLDALSFDDENQAMVYKQTEDGGMTACQVTLGEKNDDSVEIVSGVEAGEIVYVKVEAETTTASSLFSMFSGMTGGMGGGTGTSTGSSGRGSYSHGSSGGGFSRDSSGGGMPSGGFGGMN